MTGCTATSVYVDWGDGTATEWGRLLPDERLYHTYGSYGVYYTGMHAEFDPSNCQNTSIDLTFVFEYPEQ